ncbi:MAG: DUF3683 domain-containing protein [Nitrospinae bacterium]|nr:DUF3683 domain-containing protein [Nitrospinota bacterium]
MRIREIPYNYTSFSDREIVIRFLGEDMWNTLNDLRSKRRTGRSARMLFEVLGDLWMVSRNPFIQEDLQADRKRLASLLDAMGRRLDQIEARADSNPNVLLLAGRAREAVKEFADRFSGHEALRAKVLRSLSRATRRDNVDFSGVALVSHVTDATDWRVECPFAVVYPELEEETADIVKSCMELDFTIIPRGGGTGYTGSGVPLVPETIVINTEKLDFINAVELMKIPGRDEPVHSIRAGAGAVTKRVAEAAEAAGMVFAVDPTSQNASTVGGNIAMNAGGKKAVRWGSTLDNLISWRMVGPDGQWLEVVRLNHNMGKLHDLSEARFQVTRFQRDGKTPDGEPQAVSIPSDKIRKPGLGKDVTNKFLGGLPGAQKEGCDGIITSAVFALHPKPAHIRAVCLEFFGHDLAKAVPAIVEIKNYLDQGPDAGCAGLEHMDERYVKAVGYNTKARRGERPKMVLLVDVAGDQEEAVDKAASHVVGLAKARGGEGFIAASPNARERFWADRARTAAIAAHTNAFKVNEDVVIPLERLAEYTEGIERINIEQSVANKLRMARAVIDFLKGDAFAAHLPSDCHAGSESEALIEDKKAAALSLLREVEKRWEKIIANLDSPISGLPDLAPSEERLPLFDGAAQDLDLAGEPLIRSLLRRDLRVSYRAEAERPLKNIFIGDLWAGIRKELDHIHAAHRSSRLFAAVHMHAGDGNAHTNIPVNSNDYEMLREAERMVERIMSLAVSLGGAISGEHGIGVTKLHFMDQDKVEAFASYKEAVDPKGRFNKGKLLPGAGVERAYTPSLRLVQQEALILRESALGDLNDGIRNCLRCGKCKAVCSTHAPRANLLYSPRNKILAAGLIIEAFLYEEQTKRGISIRHFDELNDLSDHCSVCRKCVVPCPVDIDFGLVTISMREILKSRGKKKGNLGARMALGFLKASDPRAVSMARKALIQWGYSGQRIGHKAAKSLAWLGGSGAPGPTAGKPSFKDQMVHLLKRPLPEQIPDLAMRAFLGIEDNKTVPILRDPAKANENSEAVFYFPGCGSERLFSQVSLAVLALLRHLGVQTVLPPGYLCCGFPLAASGDRDLGRRTSTANRVLFHRVANTLNYLDVKTVLVSCGTCLGQLEGYEFHNIFPECRLMDIHEYLMEKGVRTEEKSGASAYLFHDPCHSPIKRRAPLEVAETLLGGKAVLSGRCCGEAGTLAVSRPDIANQIRYSKEEVLREGIERTVKEGNAPGGACKAFTACPSCLQGLSRYRETSGLEPEFMAVELAERVLGKNWLKDFIRAALREGIEKALL